MAGEIKSANNIADITYANFLLCSDIHLIKFCAEREDMITKVRCCGELWH